MFAKEYRADTASKHDAYYRQFVTPNVKRAVQAAFGEKLAQDDFDTDSIPLEQWLDLCHVVPQVMYRLCADFPTTEKNLSVLMLAAKLIQHGNED